MISQEFVCECFDYQDGRLFWKVRPRHHYQSDHSWQQSNSRFAGKPVGCLQDNGYIVTAISGTRMSAHRLTYLYHFGVLPENIDHINGDRSDNRIENLRPCSDAENKHNTTMKQNNTSGVKGVTWNKKMGKWVAMIQAFGRKKYLGAYESLDEAAIARQQAANEMHGAFARHA